MTHHWHSYGVSAREDHVPTYQYACTACGHQLEAVQSFADEPLTECPACEGRLRKLFSSVGVVFKGSGFYRNDSRASASATDAPKSDAAKAESAKSDSSKSESAKSESSKSESSKSESSKSETKSSAKPAAAATS
jgi:putative FmdB family regulatory protein